MVAHCGAPATLRFKTMNLEQDIIAIGLVNDLTYCIIAWRRISIICLV